MLNNFHDHLNSIENLWKILKNKVALKNPKTVNELKKAIDLVWRKEISKDLCKRLVYSIKRRISMVLKNNGGHTKY